MLPTSKNRELYVPSAARVGRSKEAETKALSLSLLQTTVGDVFMGVPWTGVVVAPPTPIPTSEIRIDMRAPARVAFAEVAWTGEKAGAPTEAQQERSVRSLLASFKWE